MTRLAGAVFLITLLSSMPARADLCALNDQATADRAVTLIRDAGTILDHDWFEPIAVETVESRRDERSFRVVVNGDVALDLAYTYIRDADGYRHLGMLLDCDPGDWPATLPAAPFTPAAALASSEPDPADRLLGLVGVPAITPWVRGGSMGDAGEIRLYDAPGFDAAVIDVISDWTDLPTREYDYEVPGAIVRWTRGDWYRIETQGGGAWLAPADAGPFRPYEELVRDHLTYLSKPWDGRVHESPARDAPAIAIDPSLRAHARDELPVEVEEVRDVEGALWFRVAINWSSFCSGEEPKILARGWIRAYDGEGAPAVWFYSRGC